MLSHLREPKRTYWQLCNALTVGPSRVKLAGEVIASKQCLQRKWELIALMAMVKKIKPRVVLEIGTYKGGTLRCWAQVAALDAMFISIDLPEGAFGGGSTAEEAQRFPQFLRGTQTLHPLRADSHDPYTLSVVLQILRGREIDFLFIDGDHTYDGVRLDYELYRPLVREGGLIAFHDVVPHSVHADCRVHEFWAELKSRPDAVELIDRDGFSTWGGIGVVRH